MIDLTALSPLQLMVALGLIFLAAVGANHICHALLVGAKSLRRIEPAVPTAAPEPVVVVQQAAPVPDLLPLPVSREVAPIFAQVPLPLPVYDSREWRYSWDKPADPHATGSFPEIRLELEDDAVVPPTPLPGWERKSRRNWPLRDPALAEAAKLLPRKSRKPKADAEVTA